MNREAYEQGKLKKFLTQTKFIMQDTLMDMTRGSVKRYVDSVLDFLPLTVAVKSTAEVTNMYYSQEEIKRMGADKVKFPLFRVDLELGDDNRPQYSSEASDVCSRILETFKKGLSSLSDITQLEQKLLPHLFKSSTKMFLKVPVKPEEMPDKPDPENKKLLPDENAWVYEEFMRLRSKIFESVDPLADYLKTYDQFQSDYNLDPDAEIAKMDDEENPPEPDALRRDVLMRRQRALKL
jgi:dynein heavy chain